MKKPSFDSPADNGKGLSTAHRRYRLLLLPSGPDKVHRVLLRRTQTEPAKLSKDDFLLQILYGF